MKSLRIRLLSLGIRWRLTVLIAASLIVVLAVLFAALRISVTRILDSDLNDDVAQSMGQITARVAIGGSSDPQEMVSIAEQADFPVVVYDPEGQVIAASPNANTGALNLSAGQQQRIMAGETITRTVGLGGQDYRVRAARFVIGEQTVGILQVGRSTETIERVTSVLTSIMLGGGVAAVAVVIVIAYVLSRSALRPIEQITQLAAEMEASDLTRRINVTNKPSEVQRLADTFDLMLQRLEGAFNQQKNFVLDVSHELRTPLTVLRGNLDVMLMEEGMDEESRDDLERMRSEVERLIRLTSNLLYLAHAEAGREVAQIPVELDRLCEDVLREMGGVRSGVELRFDHRERVSAQGDPDLLKQLLLNLVDNGIKYTQDGGEVTVSTYQEGETARIVVRDNGPGIPPEQLDQIFERFYRGANGRYRAGGSGIGLAISLWVAQAHGGDITVDTDVGRGTTFTVTLRVGGARGDVTAPAGSAS